MMFERALLAVLLCASAAAQAQLRLPGGLPPLPGLPAATTPGTTLPPRLAELVTTPLQDLRSQTVRALLRDHAAQLEVDPRGEPVVRGELIALAPSPATLAAAQAQGFVVLREQTFEGLDLRSVVFAPPPGMPLAQGAQRLRTLEPALQVDYQHIYTRSGGASLPAAAPTPTVDTGPARATRIGLIDGGVERTHPALRAADIHAWGCDGQVVPSPHGTAIASLLVGHDARFVGAAPGATLLAADVYCGRPTGGSVEAIAQALAWLARERVAVINISLVGPPNQLLEAAVRAVSARGHVVVAAVGNDGPAAPPLYPAAYAEVVGVTGVAPSRRVLPEAAQGPHVAFAAPGSELVVAQPGRDAYARARGTSFAAPLVAAQLASMMPVPNVEAARRAVAALAARATDLGAAGRDPIYGWGLVAEDARVARR